MKLGSIVFGSGYVLVSYLHSDLVVASHWLTESQLLATVAIGQVTPGPVFTTATSIGYVVAGLPGAVLATLAIFLPSFVLVAALMPLLSGARRSKLERLGARWRERGGDRAHGRGDGAARPRQLRRLADGARRCAQPGPARALACELDLARARRRGLGLAHGLA